MSPVLIQMPLILAVLVIVQPLKFMLGKASDAIDTIVMPPGPATINSAMSHIYSAADPGSTGNLRGPRMPC